MQLGLDCLGDIQSVDEIRNGLRRDGGVGARQLLERLVGVGIALAAQNGLDSLGDDSPGVLEVRVNGRAVQQQFAQPLGGLPALQWK